MSSRVRSGRVYRISMITCSVGTEALRVGAVPPGRWWSRCSTPQAPCSPPRWQRRRVRRGRPDRRDCEARPAPRLARPRPGNDPAIVEREQQALVQDCARLLGSHAPLTLAVRGDLAMTVLSLGRVALAIDLVRDTADDAEAALGRPPRYGAYGSDASLRCSPRSESDAVDVLRVKLGWLVQADPLSSMMRTGRSGASPSNSWVGRTTEPERQDVGATEIRSIVDLGEWLRDMGVTPSEHPSFGGVHDVTRTGRCTTAARRAWPPWAKGSRRPGTRRQRPRSWTTGSASDSVPKEALTFLLPTPRRHGTVRVAARRDVLRRVRLHQGGGGPAGA